MSATQILARCLPTIITGPQKHPIPMQRLVFRLVEIFSNWLTKRLDGGSKTAAIVVKGFFVLLAAAPFAWIYLYGGQYLGRGSTSPPAGTPPVVASAPQQPTEADVGPSSTKVEAPKVASSGLATYTNSRFGFRLTYPQETLYPQGESANGDGQVFASADGTLRVTAWGERRDSQEPIAEIFAYESRGLAGANRDFVVTYKRQKDNWFVVSGTSGAEGVYRRALLTPDYIARYEVRWNSAETERWRPIMESLRLTSNRGQ
jgi:hypothetical protein